MDIFGDLQYFQKKFENLKNSFSRTSLTWNGTKSWILVTLAHLARKWQTGLWRPGQICPPLFQIGLTTTEKYFPKQQTNVCSFYKKHNFFCEISILISSKTTEKKFVNDHIQKCAEITKKFLWTELQNYYVEPTEKIISLSADWL